jgi:hypothetical protein
MNRTTTPAPNPRPHCLNGSFVSRTTIKTHLAHIYAKLAIANRAQLAVEAHRHLTAGEEAHDRDERESQGMRAP